MHRIQRFVFLMLALVGVGLPVSAQVRTEPPDTVPIYRILVVARTTKAVNFRHRGGATKVGFRGTELMPAAHGEAKVESKQGYIEIEVEFDELQPATRYGPEYLTYVMWAVTPEGRATNLGEILLNGTESKLNVTTELQAFGLIVTAEPHFGVTRPSNLVVMENVVRADTRGKIEEVEAKYELLERGQYTLEVDKSKIVPIRLDPSAPLELYEARNAVRIAAWAAADRYAADTYQKAESELRQAEDYHRREQRKPTISEARKAVQTAEDARNIALKRRAEEQLANERRAAAERTERARAETEAEVQRRRQAEADRARAEVEQRLETERRARAEAEQRTEAERRARAEAEQRAEADRRQRAEADSAAALEKQRAAQADAERARQAAEESERGRKRAEQEQSELRARLLQQLNVILETRDTARGLIVNMSDVLFDSGKHTLRAGAREKLAKISGIVLSHPGLRLEVEGHTDNVGSDEFNQKLSERRAESVRDFLIKQGVPDGSISARGFGETQPAVSNDNAAGRQQNRRVELVVSGEAIGIKLRS